MVLSVKAGPASFLFLSVFAALGLFFSFSHIRFAIFHPGSFSMVMPLSLVHLFAGIIFFTFTVTSLFI